MIRFKQFLHILKPNRLKTPEKNSNYLKLFENNSNLNLTNWFDFKSRFLRLFFLLTRPLKTLLFLMITKYLLSVIVNETNKLYISTRTQLMRINSISRAKEVKLVLTLYPLMG